MAKNVYWRDVVFPEDIIDFTPISNKGLIIPAGSSAQRPSSPPNGTIRYNTTLSLTEIFQDSIWSPIFTTGMSGEANTASNLGSGQPIFRSKSGLDLQFRSLRGGTNVTVSSNATEVVINAATIGENNTASNVGGGTGMLYDSKLGSDLQFKTLTSLTPNLTITTNGNLVEFDIPTNFGEINTSTNTGGGIEFYRDKIGVNFRFRTIDFTASQLSVVQNSATISLGIADNPVIPGSASITIPSGSAGSQPVASNGMMRYDTSTNQLRAVIAGTWQTISTTAGTFLPLSGGTLTGHLNLLAGVNIVGGANSQIMLQGDLTLSAGADIVMSSGGNIIMQSLRLVDGRDVSVDGGVLDNINATGQTGLVARVSNPSSFAHRTIQGTSESVIVTNGSGVAGNPTISLADNLTITGTGSVRIPVGTTAQRSGTPLNGMLRYNSTLVNPEFYYNSNWYTPLMTLGGEITANVNMGGYNITNVGLVDGRDVAADAVTIDTINSLPNNSGVLVKVGGAVTTEMIIANPLPAHGGIVITNGGGAGPIGIGIDITSQPTLGSITGAEELLVNLSSTHSKTTISDIVAYAGVGGLANQLDVAGEFGFLTRTADGSPVSSFSRRTIVADVDDSKKGIRVANGNGVSGNPTIGIDIPASPYSPITSNDAQLLLFDPTLGKNYHSDIAGIRNRVLSSPLRASVTTQAVNNGKTVIPLSIGTGDFDPGGIFTDGTDSFMPPLGTYQVGLYAEADASTTTGRYHLRLRRDGVAEGSRLTIVSDGSDINNGYISDLIEADGTEAFTVEIDNTTGSAATIAVVRLTVSRVF